MGLFDAVFKFLCDRVFDKVDVNNNRTIEAIEAEVAILSLYNVVNKRVPGWQDPPSRARIMESLKAFDKDGDGALNKDEFFYFAKDLLKNGPDAFFARVGKQALYQGAGLPAAATGLKKVVSNTPGLEELANVPLAVLAPLLGTTAQSIRALIPI